MIIDKIKNIDDTYFDVFMSISEALTGFSIFELQGTGLAKFYYEFISKDLANNSFYEFLGRSKYLVENTNFEKNLFQMFNAVKEEDSQYKYVAEKIIKLWYQGTWEGRHIHENSYKEGLIWKAIHSHPPGAKQPGFKSWSINPKTENL